MRDETPKMQEKMRTLSENEQLKMMAYWLFFCCFSVFCMIIVGAITRLSGSGLSIVEWKPLMGALPPMSEQEWHKVFDLYKHSPQFKKENFWMELEDFKAIFFWEWFHRLLGRLIGVFYALPFLFFLVRGWIPSGYKLKLFGIFLLGGAQGFMGWYMVKSGLVDVPAVSHYRLAAHLSLALLIYVLMLWIGMTFLKSTKIGQEAHDDKLFTHGWVILGMLILTIFWGAYTAGLDAGLVYNDSFPLMGGRFIPEEVWFYKPYWMNFFENHAGVQFVHRWLAITTFFGVLSFVIHAGIKKRKERCFPLLGVVVFLQVGLGIATLFSNVHLHVAVTHQAGAVILLSLLMASLHHVRFKPIA